MNPLKSERTIRVSIRQQEVKRISLVEREHLTYFLKQLVPDISKQEKVILRDVRVLAQNYPMTFSKVS
jgi:hypothetical protein